MNCCTNSFYFISGRSNKLWYSRNLLYLSMLSASKCNLFWFIACLMKTNRYITNQNETQYIDKSQKHRFSISSFKKMLSNENTVFMIFHWYIHKFSHISLYQNGITKDQTCFFYTMLCKLLIDNGQVNSYLKTILV